MRGTPTRAGRDAATTYAYLPSDAGQAVTCRGDGSAADFALEFELDGVRLQRHEIVFRTTFPAEGPNEDDYAADGDPITCYAYQRKADTGDIERLVWDQQSEDGAQGPVTRFVLNQFGNVKAVHEPLGRSMEYKWSIEDASGEEDAPPYNQIVEMIESLEDGRKRFYGYQYQYDERTGFIDQSTVRGPSASSAGDTDAPVEVTMFDVRFGKPEFRVDRNGVEYSWSYNDDGTLQSVTNGRGVTRWYSYDPGTKLLTSERLGATDTDTYSYDAFGYPSVSTHHLVCVGNGPCTARDERTSTEYDAIGRLESSTTPEGHRTELTRDLYGSVTAKKMPNLDACPDGAPSEFQELCQAAGLIETATYDPYGRKLTETDVTGHTLTYRYTTSGRVRSIHREHLDSTRYRFYDNGGRLIRDTE